MTRIDAAIYVDGVSKGFREVRALSSVGFAVGRGSIFGLVGPNGAGKTTLIRILVGALLADSGSVRIQGADPVTEKDGVRKVIGYMPQDPVLYSDLTARENIAFFARGHLTADVSEKVDHAIEFAGLGDVADRPARTLSGGIQRRVSLAATIVHTPDVLFLDEPTAGVDPELRHTFWKRFRRLADQGTTVVISTHQMDEVAHCDRVAIFRAGKILAEREPMELFGSGRGSVRVRRGEQVADHPLPNISSDLPGVLQRYGLDPSVTAIEINSPTIEDVILGLIEGDTE